MEVDGWICFENDGGWGKMNFWVLFVFFVFFLLYFFVLYPT